MKRQFAIVTILSFVVIIATACNLFSFMTVEQSEEGWEIPPPPSANIPLILTGVVVGTVDDCAFDGICALLVESSAVTFTVIHTPGMMRCEGTYDGSAVIGDTVEVYGNQVDQTTLTICDSSDYFISVVGGSSAGMPTPPAWDRPFTFTGTVTGTIDDCAFDGICALVVEGDGVTYEVIYAPGMMMCEGTYDGSAVIGDTVEVYGELAEQTAITICISPDYYINVVE